MRSTALITHVPNTRTGRWLLVGGILAAGLAAALPLAAARAGGRRPEFIYVQNVTHDSAIVAWGRPRDGGAAATLWLGRRSELLGVLGARLEDVGEASPSHGRAELVVRQVEDGRPVPGSPFTTAVANWLEVPLPEADAEYRYELRIEGERFGDPIYYEDDLLRFRSMPDPASPSPPLAFLAFGDYGTGDQRQWRLAAAMARLADQRESAGRPLRFAVTTGDNLYDQMLGRDTGGDDRQFFVKLFGPYQRLMSRLPLFPSLGNHDGSQSERPEDLAHYRDNFFLPPAVLPSGDVSDFTDRFYAFSFGRDVRLLCLDTTTNEETIPGLTWVPLAHNRGQSEQMEWLEGELDSYSESLKIAYFHHPIHTAAPEHQNDAGDGKTEDLAVLERILAPRLEQGGVRLALSGHAHNFQLSRSPGAGRTHYVVSGSGGETDEPLTSPGDLPVLRREAIEATNARREASFLLVEVEDGETRVFPYGYDPASGDPVPLPLFATDGTGVHTADADLYHPISISRTGVRSPGRRAADSNRQNARPDPAQTQRAAGGAGRP